MRQPVRRCHRGNIVARRSQRRFWQGLLVFAVFNAFTGVLQNALSMTEQNAAQASRIQQKEKRAEHLERTQRDLLARLDYLGSDPGVVAEARALGFQKAGERRVVFDSGR